MSTLWNSWGSTFLVALLAGFSLSAEFASAQDVQASILVETGGQPSMSMDYRANARGVRVDITQSQPLSIIWMQGPPPKILLLQHANRRYIELGEPKFQMIQQLKQQMWTVLFLHQSSHGDRAKKYCHIELKDDTQILQ